MVKKFIQICQMDDLLLFFSVPVGFPDDFLAVVISSTSIVLTWDPPPIHERNGIITTYTITQVGAGNTSTLTTSALMLTVDNLRPFTSYTFDIAASTAIGRGPMSVNRTVMTFQDGRH